MGCSGEKGIFSSAALAQDDTIVERFFRLSFFFSFSDHVARNHKNEKQNGYHHDSSERYGRWNIALFVVVYCPPNCIPVHRKQSSGNEYINKQLRLCTFGVSDHFS